MSTARLRGHARRTLAPAAALALLFGGATACSDDSAGPEGGTTVEDIAAEDEEDEVADEPFEVDAETAEVFADPAAFVDQEVTVSAQVSEVISEQAFVIGNEEQQILVVGAESLGVTLMPGVVAQVQGVVKGFNLVEVEEALGVDLDDDSFVPFEGQNYIISDNVDLLNQEGEEGQ